MNTQAGKPPFPVGSISRPVIDAKLGIHHRPRPAVLRGLVAFQLVMPSRNAAHAVLVIAPRIFQRVEPEACVVHRENARGRVRTKGCAVDADDRGLSAFRSILSSRRWKSAFCSLRYSSMYS